MHEYGTESAELRGLKDSKYRIAQWTGAEPSVLIRAVDRKTGEHHDRYRVRHVAAHSAGRRFLRHTAGSKGIVTDDSATGANHIRARSAGLLVGESTPFQPVVEGGNPGVERSDVMRGCEVLRRAYLSCALGHRSQGALEVSKRRSAGLSAGGLSSAAAKRLYAFSSSGKNRRSSRDRRLPMAATRALL